jgi:tetratricopeptide (TPR) repeat protein
MRGEETGYERAARPRHGRVWAGMILAALAAAGPAYGDCRAGGRKQFTAALQALARDDLAMAARLLLELVEAQPDCAEVRNNLAVVFVEQGRLQDAADQLEEAIRARPHYALAQRNLQRVDALLQATAVAHRSVETPTPPLLPSMTPTEAFAEAEVSSANGPPTAPPVSTTTRTAAAATPSPTQNNARGTTVSVIEPSHNRICVHQRNSDGISDETCYQIAVAQVRTWPRWLVATEVTPQRIRLRDESGQMRLEIVRENVPVTGDAVRLRPADFDAFAQRIVPWRTAWVILE